MKIADVIGRQIATIFKKRGELEPPDLVKALEREVTRREKILDGVNVVPNDYTIYLFAEDFHRLSAARVLRDLHEAVERKVIRENYFMDGTLNIKLEKMLRRFD